MGGLQLKEFFIRVKSAGEPLFAHCHKIYKESFPVEEQRTLEEQQRVFGNHDNFYFYAITAEAPTHKESFVVGFITYWEFSGVLFGEHLAIDNNFRGMDIGGKAIEFLKLQSQRCGKPLILEIEPPTDSLKKRREGFYLRHKFVINQIKHFQPPFHKGMAPLELVIMSFPKEINQELYSQFYTEYKAIMPSFD